MKRSNPATRSMGLLALANALVCGQMSIATMDTASTNRLSRADEQTVVALERMGRYEEAEARCIQWLQQNPNDATPQRLLAEIQNLKQARGPRADLTWQINSIIIPEVNFREAGVADIIEFLRTESKKISGAENPINFVWKAPEAFKTAKITLSLHQVPLAEALKYVTEIAGLRYRVDPYAVVIYQPAPAPPEGPSPSKP